MTTEQKQYKKGIVDTSVIVDTIRYYLIIGVGFGLLGVILLTQIGGGEGISGGIVGSLLSLSVLSFSILSGPIIAAFVGMATQGGGVGDLRTRAINSGLANGIGFAIFGVVVSTILWAGLLLMLPDGGASSAGGSGGGGNGPIDFANLVRVIILMIVPNSLVGGSITFSLGDVNREQKTAGESVGSNTQGVENDNKKLREKVSRRQLLVGSSAAGALALVGGWYRFIRKLTPVEVVEKWWEVWQQGDAEAARELFHLKGPLQSEANDASAEEFGPDEGVSWNIEERTVTDKTELQNNEEATVRETFIWNDDTGRYRITRDNILRTEDGQWKVWNLNTVDSEEL